MTTSVERAFFHSGRRKAGTPLEIASTPVTAAPPDAKARRTTNSVAPISSPLPAWPTGIMPGLSMACGGRWPNAMRAKPTASRATIDTMKK